MMVSRWLFTRVVVLAMIATIFASVGPSSAFADTATCTITWKTTAATRSWQSTSNWEEGRIPIDGDHVCIPGGIGSSPITFSSSIGVLLGSVNSGTPLSISGGGFGVEDASVDSTLTALTFNGGAIYGAAEIRISEAFDWTGGIMAGSGITNVLPGATATIQGGNASFAPFLEGTRTLRLQGTSSLTSGGIYARGAGSSPRIENSGTWSISTGTTLSSVSASPQPTPTLLNTGSLSKTGAGTLTINWKTENDGAMEAQAGDINLNLGDTAAIHSGSFASSGPINAVRLSGGGFNLGGGNQISGKLIMQGAGVVLSGDVTGTGSIEMGTGSLSGPGDLTLAGNITFNGGAWSGDGTTTVEQGVFTWSAGTLGGSGSTVIAPDADLVLQIIHPSLTRAMTDSRTLVNRGTGTFQGSGLSATGAGSSPRFVNEGSLEVTGSARFNKFSASPAPAPTWLNTGTITSTGTAVLTVDWIAENDGVIEALGGDILLNSGDPAATHSGTFGSTGATAAVLLAGGTFSLAGGNQFNGRVVCQGAGVELLGNLTATGSFELSNGGVYGSGDLTMDGNVSQSFGSWGGSGTTTVTGGNFAWSGGILGGSGKTVVASNGTMNLNNTQIPAFLPKLSGTRVIENWGTGTWTQGDIVIDSDASVEFQNHGSLELDAMGARIAPTGSTAKLKNTGSIRKTGPGNVTVGWWLDNDGTIDVESGVASLFGDSNEISDGDFAASGPGSKLFMNYGRVFRLAGGNSLGKPGDQGTIQTGDLQLIGDVSAAGRIEAWLGSVTGAGDFVFQGLMDMQSVTWAGDGDLIAKSGSTIDWRSGIFSGTGNTLIEAGSSLLVNGGGRFAGTRTLSNYGLVHLQTTTIKAEGGPSTDVLFRNAGTFKFNPLTSVSLQFGTERARIVNTGAIEMPNSTDLFGIYWAVENDGLIDVPKDVLELRSLVSTDDSLVRLGLGDSASETAKIRVTSPMRIAGNVVYDVNGSFQPTVGQQFTAIESTLREGEVRGAAVTGMDSPPAVELSHTFGNVVADFVAAPAGGQLFASMFSLMSGDVPGGSDAPNGSDSGGPVDGESMFFGSSSTTDAAVSTVRLDPSITFEHTSNDSQVVPGDDPRFSASVRNDGADLELTGNIEVAGLEAPATISSLLAYLEYRDANTGDWIPLSGTIENLPGHTPEFVPPLSAGLSLDTAATPAAGVTYGSTPIGTTLDPGATAHWTVNATTSLTPAQIELITDPAQASGVRYVYRAELKYLDEDCPDPQVAGAPVVAAIATPVQNQSGSLYNAEINGTLPDGRTVTFDAANTPELAELEPGEHVEVDLPYVPELDGERGANETQADYLNRLATENGKPLDSNAVLDGQTQLAAVDDEAPLLTDIESVGRVATTTQFVPILGLDKSGPDLADAGSTVVYNLALRNDGGATASPTLTDEIDGESQEVVGAPAELAPTASASAQANVVTPAAATEVTDLASVTWTDRNGNSYGPISDTYTTELSPGVEQPNAPPVDTEAPVQTFDQETSFLYEGDDAIQTGVDEGTINPQRVGVLRGIVKDRDGQLLSGVRVTVLGHPEYGSTVSRVDGGIYMAVNGGEPLTLSFEKAGYLTSQRRVEPDWNDYTWLEEDVVLIGLNESVDTIDVDGDADQAQVAQSDAVTDASGTRRSTLIFNPDTTATAINRDGTEVELETASVRSSEFTVGPNGPEAMPGELPPTSAYTYAAALTADEAIAIGADHVRFNKPVINYVENFINIPVGQEVPSGYQNPKSRVWVPDESGRVVEVLDEVDGRAVLDVNGDGVAANAAELADLGIGELELEKVAELYSVGESLWRVPVTHFSDHAAFNPDDQVVLTAGKDFNYNMRPSGRMSASPEPRESSDGCENSNQGGHSVIECESQAVSETVPLEGVPSDLTYSTNRMQGFEDNRSFTVPLSDDEVPEDLVSMNVIIKVAGRREVRSFEPEPNKNFTYVWDGLDAFGRAVTGSRDIEIRVGYAFKAVYGSTPTFSQPTNPEPPRPNFVGSPYFLSADFARQEFSVWQTHNGTVSQYNAEWAGLGGWSLDFHHFYDPKAAKLYRGDGSTGAASPVKLRKLQAEAGTGVAGATGDGGPAKDAKFNKPQSIAATPDGSLLIADTDNNRIRKIATDGTVNTIAGTGSYGFSGDGGPATAAKLANPRGVTVGPGGVVYIADTNNNRIRMIDGEGNISTVAGGGPVSDDDGDGGSALDARLSQPSGVVAASWGDLFIADTNHNRVRRVLPDGKIHAYAGTGRAAHSGDGDLALKADLNQPHGLALDRDGNLLIADTRNNRVREVAIAGTIDTVAGGGASLALGDFELATDARLSLPAEIALTPSGDLYIADAANDRIRRVTSDGFITSAAEPTSEVIPYSGDDAATAGVSRPKGVAVSPSGAVVVADTEHNRIVKFATISGGFDVTNILIPSSDGAEIYEFTPRGQHVKTVDAKTGATLLTFEYDDGRLLKVTDGDGNETTIEHEDGQPSAIVGPYGQRAELSVDAEGRLDSVTTPSGATYGVTYQSGDLLKTFTKPNGATTTMTYDSAGRLQKDENAADGFMALERTDTQDGHKVDVDTAMGRRTTYELSDNADGYERKVTDPAGNTSTTKSRPDGTVESTDADGTKTTGSTQSDPRLGLRAPFTSEATVEMPSGRTISSSNSKDSALANPDDPLTVTGETQSTTVNGKTAQTQYERIAPFGQSPVPNTPFASVTATSPTGRESSMTADAFGRPLTITEPGIEQTSLSYDARGRLTSTSAGARSSSFTYDAQSNLQSVTDPIGRQTTFEYDPAGRTTAIEMPGGRRTEMTYDVNGNLTSVSPPARPAHTFAHSLIDLVTAQSAPEVASNTRTTTYEYDADKALTKATRPSGDEVTLDYDTAGRLASSTSPDGDSTFAYSQSTGQLAQATSDDNEQTSFDYDGPLTERIESTGTANGAIDFTYDSDLRTSSITTPGGQTNLTYDDDSLLTSAGAMNLTRTPSTGQLTGTSLASTTSSITYNTFGEPTQEATTYPSGSYEVSYTRDAIGRITTRTEVSPSGTKLYAYTYDPAGRLTEVTENGNPYRQYTYDANGNRTSVTKQTPSGPETQTATYDLQDRQQTHGNFQLTYNANGELTEKTNTSTNETLTLTYKTSGDLKSATTPSGTELTYRYDAFGNRTAEFEDGDLKAAYLYAPGISGPIAEVNESGQEQARFVYATRSHVPDFMVAGGTTYRLVTDQLGSIRQVVNASTGSIAQEITYDPFGEVTSDSNPGFQPFGFAGGLYEPETGLTHFGAREYDAGLGRWTSSDPIGFDGGDTNLYGYVVQDPMNFIDPIGLFGLGDVWDGVKAGAGEIWEHRATIASVVATGVCVVNPAACLLASAASMAVSATKNVADYLNGDICFGELLGKTALSGAVGFAGMASKGIVVGGKLANQADDFVAGATTSKLGEYGLRGFVLAPFAGSSAVVSEAPLKKGCGC